MSSGDHIERTRQIEEGRRSTLHALPPLHPEGYAVSTEPKSANFVRQRGYDRPGVKLPNKSGAVGHEAFLKALVATKATLRVKLVSDGTILDGVIRHTDRFTITLAVSARRVAAGESEAASLEVGTTVDVVVNKHAVEYFYSLTPRAADRNG